MGWRGIQHAVTSLGAQIFWNAEARALQVRSLKGEKSVASIFYHEIHKMPTRATVIHAEDYI